MIVIETQAIRELVRGDNNAWEHYYQGWRIIPCCHQYITNIVIIQHRMSDWHHPQQFTTIALPGLCASSLPPSACRWILSSKWLLCKCWLCRGPVSQSRHNLFNDSCHILLVMPPNGCCPGFRTRRMDNASFTLTSFVSTLQQSSSSTGYNNVQKIWAHHVIFPWLQNIQITSNVQSLRFAWKFLLLSPLGWMRN